MSACRRLVFIDRSMRMRCWIVVLVVLLVVQEAICQDSLKFNEVVEVGTNVSFRCTVSHDITDTLWLFRGRGPGSSSRSIVQADNVFTPEKYSFQAFNDTTLVLSVKNATEEDDGTYHCQELGETTSQFDLVVEIPPDVYLRKQNETINDTIDVVFKEESSIQCVATGSKPLVSLSWEVNGKEETGVIIIDRSRQNERIIVSKLQYIPNIEDKILTCITGGQQAVTRKKVNTSVNVMFEPNCNLLYTNETTNEFGLICSCVANPAPSNYSIYVNGTLHSSKMESLISSKHAASVYCSASNTIGTDTSDTEELTPFVVDLPLPNSRVALIVCMAVLFPAVIVILIIVFFYLRRGKKAKATEANFIQMLDAQVVSNIMTQNAANISLPPEEDELGHSHKEKEPVVEKEQSGSEEELPHGEGDEQPIQQESEPMLNPKPASQDVKEEVAVKLAEVGDKELD